MKLIYAGPKPIISHNGIKFDNNKEDKFVYLNVVIELLKAIDHEYVDDKTYIYNTKIKVLGGDELVSNLMRYCPDIKSFIQNKNDTIEKEILHHLQRLNYNLTLSQIDKEALQNNINFMHNYLIQRFVNKSVYYCAINALANLISQNRIDYILVPLHQKFTHVLHSLQGSLRQKRYPIDTKLEIYCKDKTFFTKLQIVNAMNSLQNEALSSN